MAEIKSGLPVQQFDIFSKRFDITSEVIYIGTAPLKSNASEAAWRIKKITLSNGLPTRVQWSDPNVVWDERADLGYFA